MSMFSDAVKQHFDAQFECASDEHIIVLKGGEESGTHILLPLLRLSSDDSLVFSEEHTRRQKTNRFLVKWDSLQAYGLRKIRDKSLIYSKVTDRVEEFMVDVQDGRHSFLKHDVFGETYIIDTVRQCEHDLDKWEELCLEVE